MELIVIRDTREPNPDDPNENDEAMFYPTVYRDGKVVELPVRRATLATGDYSIAGLEDLVTIERKTLPDLIGTLFGARKNSVGDGVSNQERFRAELGRMSDMVARNCRAIIVVEASREDVWRHRYQSRVAPVSVISAVDSFLVDYHVATIWAGDRAGAQLLVGTMLARIWAQHQGVGDAYAKAVSRGRAAALPWIRSVAAVSEVA